MNAFLLSSYSFLVIIGFAGIPLTTVFGGMSFVTTLPAATTAFSWTVTFGSMVTHPPMTTLSFIMDGVRHRLWGNLSFSRLVLGPMKTLLPTWHSFDIVTWAWIIQFLPITTFLPMSQKLPMRVPSPIRVLSPITT